MYCSRNYNQSLYSLWMVKYLQVGFGQKLGSCFFVFFIASLSLKLSHFFYYKQHDTVYGFPVCV